jgi:hypothetical protein
MGSLKKTESEDTTKMTNASKAVVVKQSKKNSQGFYFVPTKIKLSPSDIDKFLYF